MDGQDRRDGGEAAVESTGDSFDVFVCAPLTDDGPRLAQELVAALQTAGVAAACDTVPHNEEGLKAKRRQRFTEDVARAKVCLVLLTGRGFSGWQRDVSSEIVKASHSPDRAPKILVLFAIALTLLIYSVAT